MPKNNTLYFLEDFRCFWRIATLTDKTIKLVKVEDDSHEKNFNLEDLDCDFGELTCKFDNKGRHGIEDWGDGTYTVYPNRGGYPYYFRPATKEDIEFEIEDCKKWGVSDGFYKRLKEKNQGGLICHTK